MNDHEKKIYLKGYERAIKDAIINMSTNLIPSIRDSILNREQEFYDIISKVTSGCNQFNKNLLLELMSDKEEELKNERFN